MVESLVLTLIFSVNNQNLLAKKQKYEAQKKKIGKLNSTPINIFCFVKKIFLRK